MSGNIVPFGNIEANYIKKFENNIIDSLFLERPYEKVFLDKYCKKYTSINTYIFGGFGFEGKTQTSSISASHQFRLCISVITRKKLDLDLQTETLQEGSTIYGNLNQCGTMGYYNVPMYQSQFGGSNIYQSFPYNWHTICLMLSTCNLFAHAVMK
ncbi:hypothetical protein WN944_003715 [Citrus x changshan-huyou]|uniref:Uncharacterized protein n=1 Tax=Citrus x changshan-huyou TaxID=2935761 RepID=A0AAP0QI88_9ROSI